MHVFHIIHKTTGLVTSSPAMHGYGRTRAEARKSLMYYFYKMYDPSCVRLDK